MKCIRCNSEMIAFSAERDQHLNNCFGADCPVTSHTRMTDHYGEALDQTYCWTFSFAEFPDIYVKTGKLAGKPYTVIVQHINDRYHNQKKEIASFNSEVLDITAEKLKTYIIFS